MKTINIYKFNELSKEAQKRAISDYRKKDREYLISFQDECIEYLNERYWNDVEVQYSLSYSQGEGLSFSGILDIDKFLDNVYSKKIKGLKRDAILNYIFRIVSTGNEGRYCFASKGQVILKENYDRRMKHLEQLADDILEEAQDYYMNLCNELKKMGYGQIEYEDSEEYISELLEVIESDFFENGKMV